MLSYTRIYPTHQHSCQEQPKKDNIRRPRLTRKMGHGCNEKVLQSQEGTIRRFGKGRNGADRAVYRAIVCCESHSVLHVCARARHANMALLVHVVFTPHACTKRKSSVRTQQNLSPMHRPDRKTLHMQQCTSKQIYLSTYLPTYLSLIFAHARRTSTAQHAQNSLTQQHKNTHGPLAGKAWSSG